MVGLALRLAHALGLHLPNDSASLNDKQNQERLRIWYSLCYLESVLFLINGRPPALRQGDLTVPRAAASGETTLGNGDDLPHLYYHNLINLTSIAMDVHQHLYSVHSMRSQNRVWSRAQKTIKSMNQRLKRWRDDLPEPLDFTIKEHPVSVGVFKRQVCVLFSCSQVMGSLPKCSSTTHTLEGVHKGRFFLPILIGC